MEPSALCLTRNTHPDPMAFWSVGKSRISKVPVSTRVLYSSVAASRHPSAWSPCIACLKVRCSGNEAEFACSPSSSSDHIAGGSASGSAERLTFHHSPGGREMRDVRRRSGGGLCARAGRIAWTMAGDAGGVGVLEIDGDNLYAIRGCRLE